MIYHHPFVTKDYFCYLSVNKGPNNIVLVYPGSGKWGYLALIIKSEFMTLTKIPYPRGLRGTMYLMAFTYVHGVCSRLYMYFYFKQNIFWLVFFPSQTCRHSFISCKWIITSASRHFLSASCVWDSELVFVVLNTSKSWVFCLNLHTREGRRFGVMAPPGG